MAPLGVVADGVAGAHPEPLGDRPVLLQLLGELALDAERLQSGLQRKMRLATIEVGGLDTSNTNIICIRKTSGSRIHHSTEVNKIMALVLMH